MRMTEKPKAGKSKCWPKIRVIFLYQVQNVFSERIRVVSRQMIWDRLSLKLKEIFTVQNTYADTIIGQQPDNTVGKGFGGITGFLIGGGAGGPIGASLVSIKSNLIRLGLVLGH